MDPKLILNTLGALDDNILATVMGQLLQQKPELAPGLVSLAVPELTYAPTKAFTEKRCSGTIKKLNPQLAMAFIDCPELSSVFGCDVVAHATQVGAFMEGTEVNFAVTLNDDNKPQAFDLQENNTPSMPSMGAMPPGPMGPGMDPSTMASMGAMGPGAMGPGAMGPGAMGPGAMGPGAMGPGAMGPGMDGAAMDPMNLIAMGPMGGMGFLDGMGLQGKGGPPMNQEVLGEFYGIVKSYNPEKGFGFIVCDALKNQHDGDVYLHSRHIGDFKVGQEVKFQAYLHNGRLQGRELQDATGMVGPQTGFAPPGQTGGEEQELGVFVGKIKNYNHEKGFGFIMCEALNLQGYQGDVFLHSKNKGTFEAGDEVAFMAVLRNGKLQAKDLQAASTVLGEMGLMGNSMMGNSMMGNPMMGGMMGDDPSAKRARMY